MHQKIKWHYWESRWYNDISPTKHSGNTCSNWCSSHKRSKGEFSVDLSTINIHKFLSRLLAIGANEIETLAANWALKIWNECSSQVNKGPVYSYVPQVPLMLSPESKHKMPDNAEISRSINSFNYLFHDCRNLYLFISPTSAQWNCHF